MDKFKQLNLLRTQKAQAKKQKSKSIGIFLCESRKKAAEQVKRVHVPFYFKGRSDSRPSKVPRPELQFSPLKVSRETRKLSKCGYNSKAESYVHSTEKYDPFAAYAIQNLGTLESFVNCCCAHIRDSGCKGLLKFVSPQTTDCPRMFEGTLFSVHTVKCSECGIKFSLESDFFEAKPIQNEKLSSFSRISQVCGVASKNMSWVFAEMEMLFACLGVYFF